MKIAIVDINNEYGGGQVFIKNVLSRIDGEKSYIIKSTRLAEELHNPRLLNSSAFLNIIREIDVHLEDIKPDVVILNGGLALFYPLVGKKKWNYIFYKHATYKGVSIRKRFIYFTLVNLSYLFAKKIICVSQYCAKEELFFKKKLCIVYHGVEIENGVVKRKKSKNEKLKFVYIGRIVKEKGCDLIFDYFRNTQLQDRELLVIGDEKKANFPIKQYKICKNIQFYGLQRNIKPFLENSDFLITLPTNEAFGLTIIEAMANGVIVIATNVGGIPEIITHKESGFLIDPKKLLRFLDCISIHDDYSEIVLNAFTKVRNCFDIQKEIENINNIIKEM